LQEVGDERIILIASNKNDAFEKQDKLGVGI